MRNLYRRIPAGLKGAAATLVLVVLCAAATQIELTTQVKGILPGANGGTANGFFAISGPATSLKTFAFPNASATVLTTNAAVTVAQGGTGVATLTNHGVLVGAGTSNVAQLAAAAADTILAGQGTGSDPSFIAFPTSGTNGCAGTADKLLYNTATHALSCGTDQTSSIGTFSWNETPTGTIDGSNTVFTVAHTPSPAASLNCYKNGQLLIAGGADFTLATATITYTAGAKPISGDVHICTYLY